MATIRLATASDADAIAAIYAPFCTSSIVSFEEVAPTPQEMAARIAKIVPRYPWLVLDDGGAVAGYAYGGTHRERAAYRWSVEVTVYVHADHQRKGVGRALYSALFPILARQGYRGAFGGVTLPNPGSEKLHEAVGFTEVGVFHRIGWKFGQWHDVRWYERSLSDAEPGELLTVEEVKGGSEWREAVAAGLALYRT